ncbi:MAG: hypothetical protein H0T42_10605 [Deltaproteobacteria bacterium]|nr:hypothetical protein [Deltaproteobacteria bacterium]
MPKVSLRSLLARLTAIALSTTAVGTATADDSTVELTADVAIDPDVIDPSDAAAALGRGLALAVARMRPIEATHLVTTWAMSEDPMRRLAVAHSLEWQFKLIGDGVVIDHLAQDPDPLVRIEIARAAWVRRGVADVYGALARLIEDPDPDVRAVALRAG